MLTSFLSCLFPRFPLACAFDFGTLFLFGSACALRARKKIDFFFFFETEFDVAFLRFSGALCFGGRVGVASLLCFPLLFLL